MGGSDAGVIAADPVVPAIGSLDDAVGGVVSGMGGGEPFFGGAVGDAVAVAVVDAMESVVAGADEVVAFEIHAAGAGFGPIGEESGFVGTAIVIGVVEDFDVSLAGDNELTLGVKGEGKDVVGQIIIGVEGDFKSFRCGEAEFGGDRERNKGYKK